MTVYYETNLYFERGNKRRAELWFRSSVEGGGTVDPPLSSRIETEADGSISIPDYRPGDEVRFDTFTGDETLRENAERICTAMTEAAVSALYDNWEGLSLPFTAAETFGLVR